jgi:hypothetical protein
MRTLFIIIMLAVTLASVSACTTPCTHHVDYGDLANTG